MNRLTYCVYNETRECFLSLNVAIADNMISRLRGLIGKLRLRADEGVWIVPSHGIHTIGVLFSLDLIYLDESNRVIELVEHFSFIPYSTMEIAERKRAGIADAHDLFIADPAGGPTADLQG